MFLTLPMIYLTISLLEMHEDPFLRQIPDEAIPTVTSPKAKRGLATMYGTPTDRKWGGGHMACAPDFRIRDVPDMRVCAHRTYRCGTILAVENPVNGLRTLCRVLDRGPFGALLEDGTWVVKIRPTDPGTWRGILDMAPTVAAAIGHTGFGQVKVWPVYVPAKTMIVKPVKGRRARLRRPGV